ncbi:MAG: Ig-like domain-containing protein [Thalassotalea sp.]
MEKLSLLLASFFALILFGCNGHNEDGSENIPLVAAKIELLLLDSDGNSKQSFGKNETITLQAKVTDENNKLVANKAVNFSASIGSLAITSKLTNSDGVAVLYLTNEALALGAGTANANTGELSAESIDYEFLESDTLNAPPVLSTVMTLNDETVNQFKSNQEAQITVKLTSSNGDGIANKIISFSADVGTLSAAKVLTNNLGVANTTLTSNNNVIGAGVLTSSYSLDENTNISSTLNYQILSLDTIIDSDIRLGAFDESNSFVEGKVALSITGNSISAGGTLGVSVDLVDSNGDLIATPVPVTFTSNCVQNGNASIDESVLSINGTASSTFTDLNCAGSTGTEDVILASVTVNNITNTASETITITGEQLGSIEFVSAEPTAIVLKGTGGQNKQETSTLTFKVKSQLGNVLAQQKVEFALSTAVGGIRLSREMGFTNGQGLVTTQVSAGTVPTAVRVVASASMDFNGEIVTVQSQSDMLSINTGLPEQRSMTIAASILNPEAHNISGEESNITVWLSDNFHNPVPDGTTVNFTAEGGVIEPSCSTTNGSCSVIWTSSEPRVADHRVTILATALGHETFFDTNGNNVFDDADGAPIVDAIEVDDAFTIDSGFSNEPAQASGFLDMSEAWRDDNENSIYDSGETFIDFNDDNAFSAADSLFNGPQCQGTNCAAVGMRNTHVRKALTLVMASSAADVILTNSDGSVVYQNTLTGDSAPLADVPNGGSQGFNFYFADTGDANQTMPFGTEVAIAVSGGQLEGDTRFTVSNNNQAGFNRMFFEVIQSAGSDPETVTLTITITSPSGVVTNLTRNIALL